LPSHLRTQPVHQHAQPFHRYQAGEQITVGKPAGRGSPEHPTFPARSNRLRQQHTQRHPNIIATSIAAIVATIGAVGSRAAGGVRRCCGHSPIIPQYRGNLTNQGGSDRPVNTGIRHLESTTSGIPGCRALAGLPPSDLPHHQKYQHPPTPRNATPPPWGQAEPARQIRPARSRQARPRSPFKPTHLNPAPRASRRASRTYARP
ncbi:MAG: hypothetical protein JWQ19_3740, partial [Subtercola sp.]|nr:hypothetical protein [Subtercola sp.]